jgi:hypothetical protein
MRKLSTVTVATILAISLYFTLVWGYDALRMLTAPNYGLEEALRADYVFVIGRLLGLSPLGLIKLAAFFGAVKLVAAGACGLHIVDRFRCMMNGRANSEVLEGGLILVVAISIISVGPAVWSSNAEVVREYTVQLVLACLATALCIAERSFAATGTPSEPGESADDAADARIAAAVTGPTLHP